MKKQLLALALIPAAFVGCTDDSYDLDNISNDFRIGLNEYLPIASSEVKLKDILAEFKTEFISEDADGTITFVFDDTTRINIKPFDIVFKSAEFEQNFNDVYDVIEGTIPAQTSAYPTVSVEMNVDSEDGNGKIEEILVKEGTIKFHFEGTGISNEDIQIQELKVAGVDIESTIARDGVCEADLAGKELKFPGGTLDIVCIIQALRDIHVTNQNANFKIVLDETRLSYKKIKGAFSSKVEQVEKTEFFLNLFDDNLDPKTTKLEILEPTIAIAGSTNCGVPLKCSVKNLVVKHTKDASGKVDSLKAKFMNTTSFPSDSYMFDVKYDGDLQIFSGTFNKNNGKLDSLFSFLPDSVSITTGVRIDGPVENGVSYYLYDSTYVDLSVAASVPLRVGSSSCVTIKDTIDGIDIVEDITDYQNGDFKLDQAEIFIEFENGLPLEAEVKAYFCHADTAANGDVVLTRINNKKLDQRIKIPAATVNELGDVVKSTPSKSKITLSDDMIEDIKKINAVDFTYKINTPSGNVNGVFLKNTNGLAAKVYAHLKANISKTEEK